MEGNDCALVVLVPVERKNPREGGCVPPVSDELGAHCEENQRSNVGGPDDGNEPERLVRENDPSRQEDRTDEWDEHL